MNAILVFDPSNDLLFAKSNKLFRLRVLKYSKLNGLIVGSPIGANATTTSSSSTSSSQVSSSKSPSPKPNMADPVAAAPCPVCPLHRPSRRHQRQPSVAPSTLGGRPSPPGGRRRHKRPPVGPQVASRRDKAKQLPEDTNKRYLEVLMLLLTPYVASLRLSSSVGQQQQQQVRTQPGPTKVGRLSQLDNSKLDEKDDEDEEDLLNKFFSSININHECNEGMSNNSTHHQPHLSSSSTSPTSTTTSTSTSSKNQNLCNEFSPRRFASIPLPVKCLENCQIVYCELHDFIFIYMQELEQVSSFKMRLLQKRIDLFARLALILFGPSLNSLRPQQQHNNRQSCDPNATTISSSTNQHQPVPRIVQSEILRQAYDVWLEHQFEASFLLEAQERLMVGKLIEKLCLETLQKVSVHLRRPVNTGGSSLGDREIHMHSLLYSGTKLVNSFSCRNSQQINADDLVLLLLLLKTYNLHHDNEVQPQGADELDHGSTTTGIQADNDTSSGSNRATSHQQFALIREAQEAPEYCYASNYNANRHTYEILNSTKSILTTTSATNSASAHERLRRKWIGGSGRAHKWWGKNNSHSHRHEIKPPMRQKRIPSQFLVFLSTSGKFRERLRVPHMIRFVPLTRGITLMLISEISTSFLSLQLNRILKILLEFGRQNSVADMKLNQLAKINDCVCAIKTYFYGPNYEFRSSQYQRRSSAAPARQDQSESSNFAHTRIQGESQKQQQLQQQRQQATSEQQTKGLSSWSVGNLFGKYLRNSTKQPAQPDDHSSSSSSGGNSNCQATLENSNLFDNLEGAERRQCCQLMCRLEDLVSNNVHTYMRRTFNLPIDERKRDALIGAAATTLRESINTFVVAPQLAKLNEPNGVHLRQFGELIDEVQLMAREELSDYLDYLAVKSSCNLTLGAPITHDMPAIKSFIYVDRSSQELLVSPTIPSANKMDGQAILEADFCGLLGRSKRKRGRENGHNHGNDEAESSSSTDSDSGSSSSELDSADESRAHEADSEGLGAEDSDSSTAGSSHSCSLSRSLSSLGSSFNLKNRTRKIIGAPPQVPATTATGLAAPDYRRTGGRLLTDSSQWRLGASGDLLIEGRSPSSSGQSITTNNSSSWTSNIQMLAPHLSSEELLRECSGSAGASKGSSANEHPCLLQRQPQQHLVDENLMKGFTCFVYNRLANGRTSYTSNDGTYVYSYFLWFKRNSGGVMKVDPGRKSEAARRLVANYDSLPSVVCDDFFNSYANCLFGHKPSGGIESRTPKAARNEVRIACRTSQLDESRGRRLIERHLTQVKEEEEEEDEELEEDEEDLINYQCSMLDDHQLSGAAKHLSASNAGRPELRESRSGGRRKLSQEDDFHMFLRSQMSGRTGRSQVQIFQGSRAPVGQPSGQQGGRPERPKCYELFCVHQASLLVHRSQILVEAEQLARRLAQLAE